ncbi:hypothetical protein MNV49_002689 [Pseudohyphozyma bogoriensis]|nr:hypothetical protein MNV49_002689 [Pseudohyphozyma bogoriensis]
MFREFISAFQDAGVSSDTDNDDNSGSDGGLLPTSNHSARVVSTPTIFLPSASSEAGSGPSMSDSTSSNARRPTSTGPTTAICTVSKRSHRLGPNPSVIARPYLKTLMSFLLHEDGAWCMCFYSRTMGDVEVRKALKELKLPIGSREEHEQDDGVVGVWIKEDFRSAYVFQL